MFKFLEIYKTRCIQVLVIVALFLVSCDNAKDVPPKQEAVLQAMREVGFMFDSTLVHVSGEESEKKAFVKGPMTGLRIIPKPGEEVAAKARYNYARYESVELKMQNGKWVVADATLNSKQ